MRPILALSMLLSANALAQVSLVDQAIRPHVASADWQAYADVSAFAADDAVAVRNFNGDWSSGYAPRQGRNLFVLRKRAELGVEKDNWQVGIEYRQQGVLSASADAVEFYHLYKQRLHPQQARAFDVDARFIAWSATGLRLAHTFTLFDALAYAPLLMVSGTFYGRPQVRATDMHGQVQYQNDDAYDFNARLLDSNSRYRYPFMPATAQTGSGTSVALALAWPVSERLSARLAINDLWSRIHWSNLPSKLEQLDSHATSYDKDGYVNYRPLLSGQNNLVDLRRTIGPSGALSVSYQSGRWSASTGLDYLESTIIPIVSARYQSGWGGLSASYEHRFGSVGLGVDVGPLRLHLRSNRFSLNQASALGADASCSVRF